jgi:hypothetical protein
LLPSSWNWTPATATLSEAVALILIVPETVPLFVGDVIEIVGGVVSTDEFFTVTLTLELIPEFPAESFATARSVCTPFVLFVVSHEKLYGAVVSAPPRLAPSNWNCTLAIEAPALAFAFALTIAVPDTAAAFAGAVIETVGGVVSPDEFFTVTFTVELVVEFPAESFATARKACVPFVLFVVSHEKLYGALVFAAPRLAPSNWNCTLAIEAPALAVAFALTIAVPDTVAAFAGAVIETVGGALVPPTVVENIWSPVTATLLFESLDRTRKWYCVPAVNPDKITWCAVTFEEFTGLLAP